MFTTRSELIEKIRLGEDSFLELKEVRFSGGKIRGPDQNDLADEIAAFANTRGGTLLLGVHDKSRDILGISLERLDAVEALVRQACEDSIKPPAAPVIERMNLPDGTGLERPIVRVDISQSLFIHQSPGGYLHRVGSSKRPIAPEQLARLFQQRTQSRLIRFDETPVPGATFSDLTEALWQRFVTSRSTDDPTRLLSKLAMMSQDESGEWRPTVAGLLMASERPHQYLTSAFIQAVAYQGTAISPEQQSAYQRDAQDITGTLDKQIFTACDFVRKNMRVAAVKNGKGGRKDNPQYDMLAVFEAVTNAVAHRDYSMSGSKIRLRMYDDRLELYTPGLLANTMTPESLPYRQAARNEAIASLLARCPVTRDEFNSHRTHIMDKRGEGVPVIMSQSETLSGVLPEYHLLDESELLLVIWAGANDEVEK